MGYGWWFASVDRFNLLGQIDIEVSLGLEQAEHRSKY